METRSRLPGARSLLYKVIKTNLFTTAYNLKNE